MKGGQRKGWTFLTKNPLLRGGQAAVVLGIPNGPVQCTVIATEPWQEATVAYLDPGRLEGLPRDLPDDVSVAFVID